MNLVTILKIFNFISIIFSALVGGLYWGPWLALSKSMSTFEPEIFLTIVKKMNDNMASLMTILTPISLLTIIPVLIISYSQKFNSFFITLIGFIFFIIALIVTIAIEVPIIKKIITWTIDSLPSDWRQLRDKWGAFHIIRVGSGIFGLIFIVIGALQ